MALPCLWGRSPSCKGLRRTCEGVRRLDTWDIEKTRSVSFRFPIGSVLGNRTPDSAVRGLRLNLLTNTPYSLIIYAVQRKIYYTEEPPSCPVLFLFFSKLFLRGLFLRVNCKSNFTELNACEPRAENSETGGPGAGTVRSSFPAKPVMK